jgi:hypothetical protein
MLESGDVAEALGLKMDIEQGGQYYVTFRLSLPSLEFGLRR